MAHTTELSKKKPYSLPIEPACGPLPEGHSRRTIRRLEENSKVIPETHASREPADYQDKRRAVHAFVLADYTLYLTNPLIGLAMIQRLMDPLPTTAFMVLGLSAVRPFHIRKI